MRVVVPLLWAGLLVATVAPVVAQEQPSRGSMLIILDASGSMNGVDEDGVAFIDKAKAAVAELVDALPADLDVGLRVYGHRESNTDPVRGCLDTELVTPVAPLDRDAIRLALDGIEASGYTPIGLSLQQAADDLPEAGPRSIVLISDGVDTCAPPDPCEVAEALYGDAIDVRIESIGFLIDTGSAAEQQLRCIAESSGGEYRTVGRADELIGKLGEVATDLLAWRPPMTLHGALEQAEAPHVPLTLIPDWLTEDGALFASGDYVGVIMPGETRWFQVDVWTNEAFSVWADLEGPPGTEVTGNFEVFIVDPSGDRVEIPPRDGVVARVALPGTEFPMIGAVPEPVQGHRLGGMYFVGFHWDAPDNVFLGSLHFSIDVDGDPGEAEGTELMGSLDPSTAPLLELASRVENGPDWSGGFFFSRIGAGETRWYRLDTGPGDVTNVFAEFPVNRIVGTGLEGEFTVEMRDLEGAPVGAAHGERPQLSQSFGQERRQARVSSTTESYPGPGPEGLLVGFSWNGTHGESVIRFEVETFYEASRASQTDQPEPTENELSESAAEESLGSLAQAVTSEEPESDNDPAAPALVAVGLTVLVGLVLGVLILRRRRSK